MSAEIKRRTPAKPDVNSGKEWSDLDLADLRDASANNSSIEETAMFLCRNRAEVKAKANELGLPLPQRAAKWKASRQ